MAAQSEPAARGSAHRSLLDGAVPDVERLIEFHVKETGTAPGRRRPDIQVVSRAAVVLTCASWEAFCEDLAAEALHHMADNAVDADKLPHEVKKTLKSGLLGQQHELAIWSLAGDGWREVLRDRARLIVDDDDRSLNTPKPDQVKEFFRRNVGLGDITASWKWARNPTTLTSKKLKQFVELRGAIAHRGSPKGGVLKKHATAGLDLIKRLAERSAESVSEDLAKHTGTPLPTLKSPAEKDYVIVDVNDL